MDKLQDLLDVTTIGIEYKWMGYRIIGSYYLLQSIAGKLAMQKQPVVLFKPRQFKPWLSLNLLVADEYSSKTLLDEFMAYSIQNRFERDKRTCTQTRTRVTLLKGPSYRSLLQ